MIIEEIGEMVVPIFSMIYMRKASKIFFKKVLMCLSFKFRNARILNFKIA